MDKNLCQQFQLQLDAYHDGELASADKRAVEEHLSRCSDCVQTMAQIDRVVHSLKTMKPLAVSSALSARLDGIVANGAAVKPSRLPALSARLWAPAAAAAAVLLMAIGAHFLPGNNAPVTAQLPAAGPHLGSQLSQPPVAEVARTAQPEQLPIIEKKQAHDLQKPLVAEKPDAPVSKERSPGAASAPEVASKPEQQSATAPAPAPAHAAGDELADLPSTPSSFNEALGVSTDEDGLYDIKM